MLSRRLVQVSQFLLLGAIVNVAVAWACARFVDHEKAEASSGGAGFGTVGWVVECRSGAGAASVRRAWFDRSAPPTRADGRRREMDRASRIKLDDAVPRWSAARTVPLESPPKPWYWFEFASGWPLPSMYCAFDSISYEAKSRPPQSSGSMTIELEGDWMVFSQDGQEFQRVALAPGDCVRYGSLVLAADRAGQAVPGRFIPLLPVWPGFAVNTLCYAVMVWMISTVAGIIVRRVRRRRALSVGWAQPAAATPLGASAVRLQVSPESA